jgi:hypothetical protein
MSDELEEALRAALRPVDPGETLTHSVMARVRASLAAPVRLRTASRSMWRWAAGVAAVMLVAGLLVVHEHQARRVREGLEARQALMQALRLTAESLELANRAVNERDSGA